jgi:hypothetical protein
MRNQTKFLLILWGLLWTPSGLTISHIGGGRLLSEISFFNSSFGENIVRIDTQTRGAVRVSHPNPFLSYFKSPAGQELLIAEIVLHYQDLKAQDRDQATEFFLSRGWQLHTHPENCIVWASKAGEGAETHVLTWGFERGVVVYVPQTAFHQRLFQEFIDRLRLQESACLW